MNRIKHGLLAILMASALGARAQSPGVSHPAIDDLGRALPTYEEVGDIRPGKTVAMFYWTWHVGHSQNNKNYDLSKIITDPAMVNDYTHPLWAPYTDQGTFFWGESVFNYYDGKDKWVIRKQLEMLGAAGVDVLFYDATNGAWTWKDGYEAVGQVMAEMRADGLDVPQFAFMLNFGALDTATDALVQLYDDVYSIGEYQDSWFMWDGKPVIMAYPEALDGGGDYIPLTSGSMETPVLISSSQTAGLRFSSSADFAGVNARCPSWGNNIGNLTLSLYSWNSDYATSVVQSPLASQTFTNYGDNAYLNLSFAPLAAGDYVWELSGATETVGVWKFVDDTSTTTSYFDGGVVSGDYDSQIVLMDGVYPQEKLNAIRNFFTFRPAQPGYESGPSRSDQWGWLENAPQNGYVDKGDGTYEWMTVGVSQNWSEQLNALSAMNGVQVHGRSYTTAGGFSQLSSNSYLYGYNFQEQWDRALQVDPDIVFITGWNEWVMGRFETWGGVSNAFPDQFDIEYSRDIEPMKGGHGDNYYYQMISNIRKFKGMEMPPATSSEKSIVIDGTFSDWADVTPHFFASKGNVQLRDGYGYKDEATGLRLHYVNNSARNDIIGSKVARNGFDVCFYVEAATNLTPHIDSNWMQLLIDIDRNKATGWEGYDLKIDRYMAGGKAILSKSSNAWNWTDLAEVDYSTIGAEMEISIPRVLLDLPLGQPLDIEFKWLDIPNPTGDIMDFYSEGEVAPSGRFNFHYREEPQTIFSDTFDVDTNAWNNLNLELPARQAGGVTNSTYTLGFANGQTLIGSLAAQGSFLKPVLVRVNTSGGGGGHAALDLDTDFGGILNGASWSLSYTGRIDADIGFSGWAGFAVGNLADTPNGAGTGFGFNMRADGTYQVWTNGILLAEVSEIYSIAGKEYTLTASFNEVADSVQLTYSDVVIGELDLGTFPTAFEGSSRFVELRNHVDTSEGDGIVDMRWDDLSIDILAAQTLYLVWAQEHGLSTTNALFSADADGDGLDNLAEYALGGDPNLADSAGILPTSDFSVDWATYVYRHRRDAVTRGLNYGMAYKLDLLSPNWIYVGNLWETGATVIDDFFDLVTNEIPITGIDQAFLQLEITGQ